MNYSDPFGIQQATPLSRTLRRIHLQKNMQLNWPEGYYGPDYIASINEIDASAASFSISLPNALAANEGTGILMCNIGEHRVVLKSFGGVQITDLEPGETKYLFCSDNSSSDGEWRITGFGATTSAANAVALAGLGTAAIGGRLNAALPVTETNGDVTITANGRAKIFVANGGSATYTLPPYTTGNSFFVGVKNNGSGTVSVVPPAGTIDGAATLALAPNESAMIFCSGSPAWYTVGFGRSTEFNFTKLVKDITAGGTFTLTSSEASNKLMQFIGTPTADVTVVVPAVVGIYYVQNSFSGPNTLTVKTASGSGVGLSSTDRAILYCDGVNVVAAQSAAVGTNISVIDGSLINPSINFSADPNTGIYRADVDTLGIASNGAEAARFSLSESAVTGRFGVGTSDPAVQLHVNSGAAEGVRLQGTSSFMSFWNTAGDTRFGYMMGTSATVGSVTTHELRDFVEGEGERNVYINGTKRLTVNKDGVVVNGSIQSSSEPYAKLSANTFTGVQTMRGQRFKMIGLGTLSTGTQNIDLAAAGSYSATLTGVVNFTFSNKPPAGEDQTVYLKLINGAANPPNWPAGTKYNKGVKPVLSAGMDLLGIWYDPELQAHVIGIIWTDYK